MATGLSSFTFATKVYLQALTLSCNTFPQSPSCWFFLLHFSDKKSERAKDLHLLKRLTTLLRSRGVEPGKNSRVRAEWKSRYACMTWERFESMLFYVLTHLFFSDILESEVKSALLDIKHPAIKKQVLTKTLYKVASYTNREAYLLSLW